MADAFTFCPLAWFYFGLFLIAGGRAMWLSAILRRHAAEAPRA